MSRHDLSPTDLEELQLKLEELFRNYDLSLDLIPKVTAPDSLLDRILDEYIGRFEEIPGEDVLSLHDGRGGYWEREKLKSLLMFSAQAVLLHENARVYKELEETNRQLAEKTNQLQEANAELSMLNSQYLSTLGFVSHEMRSPLVSILGFAELLEEGVLGELSKEQLEAVQIIVRVSRKLIEMTRNYLDLARIENGRMPLHRSPVDVHKHIVKPLVTEMAEQLASRSMTVEIGPKGAVDTPDLWADPELLRIVMTNLLSNALRYGEASTAIQIEITDRGEEYEISVLNKGEGVEAEKLPYIFSKFVDIPKSKTKERGSGLGLFNSRCIVESHGGRIWADSEVGKYFRVTFTLPKGRPDDLESRVRLVEDVHLAKVGAPAESQLERYRAIHQSN